MRIIFMGSPDFAVPSLEALVAAGHDVVAAYCQPPRPAGRGKADRKTATSERALADLDVWQRGAGSGQLTASARP